MTDLDTGKAQGDFDPSSAGMTPYSAAMTPEEKQYPLDPTVRDAEVYRDPGRFRSEMDSILFEAWFPVHPSADIAEPKDYVVWEQMGQSVVIARLADSSVTASYTPGTMVLTRPLADQQPASAAFQRHVPELGLVPLPFHPDLQHDEASTKGSSVSARPSPHP